jgi:hypothetical protein
MDDDFDVDASMECDVWSLDKEQSLDSFQDRRKPLKNVLVDLKNPRDHKDKTLVPTHQEALPSQKKKQVERNQKRKRQTHR